MGELDLGLPRETIGEQARVGFGRIGQARDAAAPAQPAGGRPAAQGGERPLLPCG
jgi:hypothetical protein